MKTKLLPRMLFSCACLGFIVPGLAAAAAPPALNSITVVFNGTKATYPDDLGILRLQLDKADLTNGEFSYKQASKNVGKLTFENWDEYSGTFTLTFQSNSQGTYYKTYTGPYNGYISGTFTITAMDVPGLPIAYNKTVQLKPGATAKFKLQGKGLDIRKTGLQYVIVRKPKTGRLDSSKLPAVAFTPKRGFKGVETLKFTVKEGASISKPATVRLVVGP